MFGPSDRKTPYPSLHYPFCLLPYSFFSLRIFIFLPLLLHPSLYLSIITTVTHVAHTCSVVKGLCVEVWLSIGSLIWKSVHSEAFGWVSLCVLFTRWPYLIYNMAGFGRQGFRKQCSSYTSRDSDIQKHLPYNSHTWQVWLQQITAPCCLHFWQDDPRVLEILSLSSHRCEM